MATNIRRIADLDPQALQRLAGRGELANVAVPPRDCYRDLVSSLKLYIRNQATVLNHSFQSLSYLEVAKMNRRTVVPVNHDIFAPSHSNDVDYMPEMEE